MKIIEENSKARKFEGVKVGSVIRFVNVPNDAFLVIPEIRDINDNCFNLYSLRNNYFDTAESNEDVLVFDAELIIREKETL